MQGRFEADSTFGLTDAYPWDRVNNACAPNYSSINALSCNHHNQFLTGCKQINNLGSHGNK